MTLDIMIDAALQGGREVLSVYEAGFDVVLKADASPVTEADHRSEAVILRLLEQAAPGIPIIAEESVAAGLVPDAAVESFLVDPLDGTREFVARNGDFTVNIALVRAGVPVAGVVYAPALGVLWAGSPETGAFRADVADARLGGRQAIHTRPAPDSIIAVGSRSHGGGEAEEWASRYRIERFVSRGSSLKFCLLASGEADLYPRAGRTMEWDTAAGDAILRAAGGLVLTLEGQPLRYGKRDQAHDADFANPAFVAYGDASMVAAQPPPKTRMAAGVVETAGTASVTS